MVHQEANYLKSENGWYAHTVRGELRLLGIRERDFNRFYHSLKNPGRSPNSDYAPAIVHYLQYRRVLDSKGQVIEGGMESFDLRRRMLSYLSKEDFKQFRLPCMSDFETVSEPHSPCSYHSGGDGSLEALAAVGRKHMDDSDLLK